MLPESQGLLAFGFSPAQVLAMNVALPVATYAEGEQIPFYEQLQQRIATLPGVAAVGAINILPLSGNYDSRGIQIEDHPKPEGQGESPQARSVTPGAMAPRRPGPGSRSLSVSRA